MKLENNNIENTPKDKNILSITFFLTCVLMTIWLLTYNYSIDKNIKSINIEINKADIGIAEINKDKNISINKLINSNSQALNDLKTKSNITGFIKHLNDIKEWYNIDLRWFNYQNWELQTSVIVKSTTDALSYNTASDFIRKYRNNKNNLFNLNFINSIKWNDKINFNISLVLKK